MLRDSGLALGVLSWISARQGPGPIESPASGSTTRMHWPGAMISGTGRSGNSRVRPSAQETTPLTTPERVFSPGADAPAALFPSRPGEQIA
jgi:hypothetical protein